jgi:rhodanese-related sulfurtransferase
LAFNIQPVKQRKFAVCGLSSASGYVNVNVTEAKQMIESNPDLVVLDVRTLEEYDSGHIENAVLIPVDELAGRIGELDKEKEILVYCGSGVRSVTASQILVDNGFVSVYNVLGGITAWRNAGYWIEIIHRGDLIIDGTQTFVIENCTYIQTGNIYVEDYAKLVVQNATLWLNQTDAFQFNIQVTISGILEAKNAYLTSQTNFGIYLNDFAQAEMSLATTQSQGDSGSVGTFILADNSQMEMHDSKIYDMIGYASSLISIHNSIISEIVAFMHCTVKIYDSTVTSRLGVTGGATVAVYNCTVEEPWLFFSSYGTYFYSKANLQNLNPGYYQFWKITLNATVEGTGFDLTLQDVWINKGWSIQAQDSEPALKVCISNSTIRLDSLFTSDVSIFNSTIYLLYMNCFLGTLFFDATVLTNIIVQGAQCYIHGNATFPMETTIDWYTRSTLPPHYPNNSIMRDYNVIARRINSDAMGNATLTLFDKNNVLVWNGTTNSLGQANFNLTFTDANYTDTLCLKARSSGRYSAASVSFLSSTPVNMSLSILGDVDGNGKVNIIDIATMARAYCSHPGDPRWNPCLDLDDDGHIGILDIAKSARNYGKTV